MFYRSIFWASILLLLGFFSPHGLAAQQAGGAVSRVELGFDQSVPGEQTFIPIALTLGAEVKIGKIITEIVFASNLLFFEEARKGTPLKSIDAEVSTRVKEDEENSENSILEVTMTSGTGEAIPGGNLVFLTFRIALEAPRAQMIKLENRSQAMTIDDPPEPVELTTAGGEIENLDIAAVFACFFYMH
jgi:hypothetical protein